MESIRAFVGHSFSAEDANVVASILKYLTTLAKLHPSFSWQHAEHPEPRVVDAKVLALLADKNLFIGICTKNERVIANSVLSRPWFSSNTLRARVDDFYWKTSDWIIQEIGLAIGRGLYVLLLVEEGLRSPGGLQGNLEYITFNRTTPEKCFDKLLGMIASLSPKTGKTTATAQEVTSAPTEDSDEPRLPTGQDWATPKADWKRSQYETALIHSIATSDEGGARRINELFLASEDARDDTSRKEWAAWGEYLRIVFGAGGQLARLQQLFAESPDNGETAAYLARAYLHYKEHAQAAELFERASEAAPDVRKRVDLLGEAVTSHQMAGNEARVRALGIRMRTLSEESGQAEKEVLRAERKLAEARKDDGLLIAAMERLLEIDPADNATRFSLAYKYSELNLTGLAAFHYIRIPAADRSAVTWNNLGVELDRLGMPLRSVAAYRKSEELGETLAMSNLAVKLLDAGFVIEAQAVLDRGLKIEGHNKNIDITLSRTKEIPDEEEEKESASVAMANPISAYYRKFGYALARPWNGPIGELWRGPSCDLRCQSDGHSLVATGKYDVSGVGIIAAALRIADTGYTKADSVPMTWLVEYRAAGRGRAFVGTISRRKEGESPRPARGLLGDAEPNPTVLMWLAETGRQIHVLEDAKSNAPRIYTLERL